MNSFNDLLKTQMILSLGQSRNALYNIFALNMFDIGIRTFPQWSDWLRISCCLRKKRLIKEPKASITCERSSGHQTNRSVPTGYQTRMDAVVQHVTTLPNMSNLLSITNHDYLPNDFEPVVIENDIYFELLDMKTHDGQIDYIQFKLFCYEHDVQYIQTFMDNCTTDYERKMLNKLGNHRYYFDQVVQSKVKGSMQNVIPTTHLLYTKTKFVTNRTFENVFFEERNEVEHRTKFFLENRAWYDKKGIPYTLGFMFHGSPGCGKTSTVKSVANVAKRHIINIQLSEIKTKTQLQHLFFNDEIHVYNGTNTEKYTIPVSERLYVIEDIDAMGDTVLRREWKKPETSVPKREEDAWLERQKESEKETIDLSFILNLLDGTLESNGRILIITTNFPERIDSALIRPGRIDMIINFKKCNRQVLKEMMSSFYDKEIEIPDDSSLDYKWSPAEVNQILFRNFSNSENALRELQEENKNGFFLSNEIEA
jgi:hypothetical protein